MKLNFNKYLNGLSSRSLLLPKPSTRAALPGLRKGLSILGFIILCFIIAGCATQKETIKDKTITISVPAIHAEFKELNPVNVDPLLQQAIKTYAATDSTYYEGETVTPRGDLVKVKVKLKDKKTEKPAVIIDVMPAPVDTTYTDTTHQTFIKESKSLSDYLIYLIIIAMVIAAILLILKIKK